MKIVIFIAVSVLVKFVQNNIINEAEADIKPIKALKRILLHEDAKTTPCASEEKNKLIIEQYYKYKTHPPPTLTTNFQYLNTSAISIVGNAVERGCKKLLKIYQAALFLFNALTGQDCNEFNP